MLRGILTGGFWGLVIGAVVLAVAAVVLEARRERAAAPLPPVLAAAVTLETARLVAVPARRAADPGASRAYPLALTRTKPELPALLAVIPPTVPRDPPPSPEPQSIAPAATTWRAPSLVPPADAARRAHVASRAPQPPRVSADPPAPPAASRVSAAPLLDTRPPEAADGPAADIAQGPPPMPSVASPATAADTALRVAFVLTGSEGAGAVGAARPAWLTARSRAGVPLYTRLASDTEALSDLLASVVERARRDGGVAIGVADDPALLAAISEWIAAQGVTAVAPETLPAIWSDMQAR